MRILYAIQGTGNGHLSRAKDIIPVLQQKGELDILVSGIQADLSIAEPVKYNYKGLSFIFGKKGGVDFLSTYLKCNIPGVLREINSLPIQEYDLIINDFEPVSAWAAYLNQKPCIALSHQCAVISKCAPLPQKKDALGQFILKNYAPSTAQYGFHFASFDENTYTPVIRKQVRELDIFNKGHYTVYLPAYEDHRLIKTFLNFKGIEWQVFSKHNKKSLTVENVKIMPIDNKAFLQSMASCSGVLCGAGFETPAEALFLNKKLMVLPMKHQYEQYCNAAALATMGVPVLKSLKKKQLPVIEDWIQHGTAIPVDFPDLTHQIIDRILDENAVSKHIYSRTALTLSPWRIE